MKHGDLRKPPRGEFRRERIGKRRAAHTVERTAKQQARTRDSHRCRWPHTAAGRALCRQTWTEAAHFKPKSLGGENRRRNLIVFCVDVHQGPYSLHSGDRRVVPLTRAKMDDVVAFEEKVRRRWIRIHEESVIGDGRYVR